MWHAPLVKVDIGLLADKVGVPPTNTLDLRQSVHDFAFSIDVRVKETKDVLYMPLVNNPCRMGRPESTNLKLLVSLGNVERHGGRAWGRRASETVKDDDGDLAQKMVSCMVWES